VDYTAFVRSAQRGDVPPVALLHGADGLLLDDALAVVTRALFPDAALAALGREVIDGRDTTADSIVLAAATLPFMTGARLVAVRHCQALPARGSATLAAYTADPNPATRLLLLADEPLTAQRDRKAHWLLGAVPAAAVVALPQRTGRALEEWLRQRAAAEGLAVSDEAARALVQWVGDDGARLLGEARKAALAGGAANTSVGIREVSAIVGEHRVSGVFDLTRAVEHRDVGLALRTLDRLLVTEEPVFLLALLTREVRTAWTIQAGRARGESVEQLARMTRRPPNIVEALAASVPPADVLARRLRRCWEVETRLKSGGAARAEMSALVAELCAER
jgi:DNA polymerase III delta subunit